MHLTKSTWVISLSCLLVSLVWLVFKNQLTFSHLSDVLFLFTLFFLIIGALLWVFASGSFDFFQYSMKKAFKKADDEYLKLSDVGKSSYRFWLEPAVILLLLSLISLACSNL